MICKKCGREYADDMFNCLWCDAPNEHHVPPEVPETVDISEVLDVQQHVDDIILSRIPEEHRELDEEGEAKVAKHPAGNFMWCAAILGAGAYAIFLVPFYVAFFHRKEILKKSSMLKFIGAYVSSMAAFTILMNILDLKKLIEKLPLHGNSANILQAFTTLGQALVYLLLCGYTSAFIMKRLAPDYSAEDYAKCSKAATLYAVPAMILSCILEQYIK